MIERISSLENSFSFISFTTGLMALVSAIISFAVIKYGINIPIENFTSIFSSINILEITGFVAAFFIGFVVYGIRYLGFDYYRRIYNSKNRKKTLYTKLLFYMFRNGTVIEECLKEHRFIEDCKKNNQQTCSYKWIETSDNVALDIWNYAKEISIKYPQDDIYKFYYYSEIFQCFDTVFLFSSVSTFVLGTTYCIIKHNLLTVHFIMIFLLSLIFFLFHFLSKKTGKSFARRFFLEIQLGLNLLKNNSEK